MRSSRPVRVFTPPKRQPKEGCQIGELFQLLGESHVLDILYVFHAEPGAKRFVHLQGELGMSPNTLSDRLRSLVGAGLLVRTAYNEIPPRVEYELTRKAVELQTVFQSLTEWAKSHDLQPVAAPAN